MASSEIRSLRNSFYMGLYSTVLKEANNSDSVGARVFYFRALLQSNPSEIFKQVNERSSAGLQAIKLLATYRSAASEQKELAFETLQEWLSDDMLKQDAAVQLIASQMYFEDGKYKDALRLVQPAGDDLERLAMQVQIYLVLNRLDLAGTACKSMADLDDDDALTQLATAWLYMATGGDKIMEASCLLQELVDKFRPSSQVLCCQAVCQIHLGNFGEANEFLKRARQQVIKDGGKVDASTLINYIVCLRNLRKSQEVVDKVENELRELYPQHPWIQNQASMSSMFDQHAKNYA